MHFDWSFSHQTGGTGFPSGVVLVEPVTMHLYGNMYIFGSPHLSGFESAHPKTSQDLPIGYLYKRIGLEISQVCWYGLPNPTTIV